MYEEYLEDLSQKNEGYRKKIQKDIYSCTYCQPYDGGDYVWIFGEEGSLVDLFELYEVPENQREKIAQHLFCPNCGHSCFEECEIIGTEPQYEYKEREYVKELEKKYGKQLDEFIYHLEKYPTLALSNKLGRKLLKDFKSNSLSSVSISGEWFRARIVNESKVYGFKDLHVAELGIPNEGRYNHSGQNHLYVARSERTAINEVVKDLDSALVWIL